MTHKSQHIVFILDRSGSMSAQQSDVIGGFNTYINEMKAEAKSDGMETIVSLVTFADEHSIVFAGKPVAEVDLLTEETYRTVGSTALLDTVFDSVSKYKEKIGQGSFSQGNSEDAPPVLVIVFTDGEENASRHASWQQVQQLIKECEALGNWTFTYIGAHAGAWSQADQLQMKRGNVLDANAMPFAEANSKLIESSKMHRAVVRETNRKSVEDFFEGATPEATPEGII